MALLQEEGYQQQKSLFGKGASPYQVFCDT